MTSVRAYHFCAVDAAGVVLRRDGAPIYPGDVEVYARPTRLCASGLHASRHPFDALRYAPGPILRLVRCTQIEQEKVTEQGCREKLVCRRRREVARIDASSLLRIFACHCATRAFSMKCTSPPDARSLKALEVSNAFAAGAATIEDLEAAHQAAKLAQREAKCTPDWEAARSAYFATHPNPAEAAYRAAIWAAPAFSGAEATPLQFGDGSAWQRKWLKKLVDAAFNANRRSI